MFKILFSSCVFMFFSLAFEIRAQENLSFSDTSTNIENVFQLALSSRDLNRFSLISGKKEEFNPLSLKINGEIVNPTDIHTRGQTTLSFPRKSLSIDLEKSVDFFQDGHRIRLKHMTLLSLAMDKYYIRNRLAFGMMKELGLLEFYYSYANLEVNGGSKGIYFFVERPQDWAIHEIKSPIVIRRGYEHSIEKSKSAKSLSKPEEKQFLNSFKSVYHLINLYSGETLYAELSQILDLENYLKWMAFNFLVKNGDYADEVFFYIDPQTGLFRVIPWDYDDIFSAFPHEGLEVYRQNPTPFIFSKEDALDRKIAEDEFLYKKYLEVLQELSSSLPEEKLRMIFEHTFSELYPYYATPSIIQNVKFDLFPDADLDKLKVELATDFLLIRGSQTLISKN